MTATAAWSSTLKVTGTAVPVTGEACGFVSGSDPNKIYQVTNAARRIWSPDAAITVKDAGSPVAAANFSFDYLFGFVTFIGHAVTGAITVDGSYLPTVSVAIVHKHSLKLQRDWLDRSSYDDQDGWRRPDVAGRLSGSCDAELLSSPRQTVDASTSLFGYLTADTPKVLEIGSAAGFWRLWVKEESLTESGEVAGLATLSMNWKQSAHTGVTCSFGT